MAFGPIYEANWNSSVNLIINIVPAFVVVVVVVVIFPFFQQCKKDLRGCLRTGEDKNVCFKKYKACMYALVPPYVVS